MKKRETEKNEKFFEETKKNKKSLQKSLQKWWEMKNPCRKTAKFSPPIPQMSFSVKGDISLLAVFSAETKKKKIFSSDANKQTSAFWAFSANPLLLHFCNSRSFLREKSPRSPNFLRNREILTGKAYRIFRHQNFGVESGRIRITLKINI